MILKILKLYGLLSPGPKFAFKMHFTRRKLNVIDERNVSRGRFIFPVRTIEVVHGSSPRSSNHRVGRERRNGSSVFTYGKQIIFSFQQKTMKSNKFLDIHITKSSSDDSSKLMNRRADARVSLRGGPLSGSSVARRRRPLDWPPPSWRGARWTRG